MKKNILSALAICAALLGCQKNEISEPSFSGVDLHATIEDDASTKTVMDENNNIRWSEGDQIVAFMRTSLGLKYQIKPSYIGKTSGYFSKASSDSSDDLGAGMELDHNVAYYPYSESIECQKSGSDYILNITLPSEQTYAAESFGNGFFPMVAVSENNNITFKNVLGGIKLQLCGTQKVKSIKLEGKNNEKLSGTATVTAYTDETKPAITMASGASTSLTLNCGSGVQLNESKATEFIIALPPVLFSKGFTMTVIDDAGNEQTIQTDKENSVLRSSLLVMPEVTLDKVPQTVDYIDEYGINHGPGVKIGETVWAPVNCGYHATDYKYGKLYQWGRKYGQGYDESDASVPEIVDGPVSLSVGQSIDNEDRFYIASSPYDWCLPQKKNLWNSGSESDPVKTEYDPCPVGWRVPTHAELSELRQNHSSWTSKGYWFSGANMYTESAPKVFFPAAGEREGGYGGVAGEAMRRDRRGYYWSSRPSVEFAYYLCLDDSAIFTYDIYGRSNGYSVRCVQE